jgi:aminomethyltransferase
LRLVARRASPPQPRREPVAARGGGYGRATMPAPSRRSPLHDVHTCAGARFTVWQDAVWPADYGDALAEHHAVRTGAGVWDISLLRIWEVRGRDALGAVGRVFTNDVTTTTPGAVRYGLLCAEDGTIVNDATVFVFGPDHAWVLTSAAADRDHIAAHAAGPGVAIAAREGLAAVQVQGPHSAALLAGLGAPVAGLPFFRFAPRRAVVAGVRCLLARVGFSGELGYELFFPAPEGERLWAALVAAGARPYGFAAVETLRIEAGLVLLGADFERRCTRPHDVSLERFVRLDGRAFTGRAALAAVAGAPPRRLVTLVVDGDRVPDRGAVVWGGRGPVGRVTSACRSPTYGTVVALAAVETEAAVPRRRLLVQGGGDHVHATVQAGPIHDPGGARRRATPDLTAITPPPRASPGRPRSPAPVPAAGGH